VYIVRLAMARLSGASQEASKLSYSRSLRSSTHNLLDWGLQDDDFRGKERPSGHSRVSDARMAVWSLVGHQWALSHLATYC